MTSILTKDIAANPQLEMYSKMQKLRRLSDAIILTRAKPNSAEKIQQLQSLENQRKALRATMPPIHLAHSVSRSSPTPSNSGAPICA